VERRHSVNDGEAMNMGREVHEAHDLRYDRAMSS